MTGYLRLLTPGDLVPGPSCEVCGAVLVRDDDGWVCLSCGTRHQATLNQERK